MGVVLKNFSCPPHFLRAGAASAPVTSSLPNLVKQAQIFANEVGDSIKKTVTQVQASFATSRNKMKKQNDKDAQQQHYQVHDKVMLWHQNKKKGISRCWQPNWSGPWTRTRLIGNLNCQLSNPQSNATPVVHVNHLKYIVPRFDHLKAECVSVKTATLQQKPTTDIFESLVTEQTPMNERDEHDLDINREENEEIVQDRAVIREQQEGGAQLDEDTPVITGGWCSFNQGNILQQRTRSQSVT